jgi:SRSO17 transposase
VEKFVFEKSFDSYFQTKTRSCVSKCIDYLKGLILLPSRRNLRKMAIYSPKRCDNQALSHFLSNSPWLHKNLSKSVRTKAIETIGTNGVIILDESGMKKSGDNSVGVSRQYCGNLGKVDNCQVGVFLAYSKGNKRTLIDFRLYLPKNWVEDKERCLKAKIPPEMIKFQTKYDLGLEMIDNVIKEEIPFSYVAMDGFYGENPELLTELENRGITFVADIATNSQVYLEKPVVGIPEKKGSRGRFPSKPKVLNTSPIKVGSLSNLGDGWELIKVRKTERGIKEVYFKALQVWRRQNELPCGKPIWLLISKDAITGEIKHSFCNAVENTSLRKLAEMQSSRYWVERAFQDAKGNCGMGEYMVRSWNAWHRHMTMVLLAMLILISYRMKFKKLKMHVSIPAVAEIIKFHNPLKVMNATQLARKLNQDNVMRMRARTSRLKAKE